MDNLFNNDTVHHAKSQCTPEQLQDYKTKGERCYNTVNFESPVPESTQWKVMSTMVQSWVTNGLVDVSELTPEELVYYFYKNKDQDVQGT